VEDLDGSFTATLPAGDVVVELALSEELRRGEIERLRKEISRVEAEVRRARDKLSNQRFVKRAPDAVVAAEREKLDRNVALLEKLKQRLDEYL
jgi:valyl-tRNA synthetase